MKMVNNGVGISRVVTALLIIMSTTTVMVGTRVAANEELIEQPQQVLRIYDILLRGVRARGGAMVAGDHLGCIPSGQPCNMWTSEKYDCCPGSTCQVTGGPFSYSTKCVWCPGVGDSCGALDPCCSGLTCDGTFSGKCH